VIAVVNHRNIHHPRELYSFFASLGCRSLNINIVEKEGLNINGVGVCDEEVRMFWNELFRAWRAKPVLRIREFDYALGWMDAVCKEHRRTKPKPRNLWPTISANGDVFLLSPELMSAPAGERAQFVVGNVLEDEFLDIVEKAKSTQYVKDFERGVRRCERDCAYYSFCGGGQASNKYFELRTMDGTETSYCRNSKKALIDVVIASLSST
jgi:uncharacterized protein